MTKREAKILALREVSQLILLSESVMMNGRYDDYSEEEIRKIDKEINNIGLSLDKRLEKLEKNEIRNNK